MAKSKTFGDLPNFWRTVQHVADIVTANAVQSQASPYWRTFDAIVEKQREAEAKRREWAALVHANMEAGIMTPESVTEERQLCSEFEALEAEVTLSTGL